MIINGKITSGLGKGAFFLSQNFYKNRFNEELGFIPFPGTLNIIVEKEFLEIIKNIKLNKSNLISGEGDFGSVRYIKAILEDKINGAIVFPDKTSHEENYLEFISNKNLRKTFNFKNNDKVQLKIVLN
jgi:riboflavin kinase